MNTFILSKLWYVAQVFPPLSRHIAEIRKLCGNFIWNGMIFRVERNQLYLDYFKGGLKLVDPEAKMKALFIKNLLYNEGTDGDFIKESYLLEFRIPQRLTKNAREWISIATEIESRFQLTSTKLLYDYFVDRNNCVPKIEEQIDIDWLTLWENLNQSFISLGDRSKLFCFANNLIATGEKLAAYNVRRTARFCDSCGGVDDVYHRLKVCPNAKTLWQWCSQVIRARMGVKINDMEELLSRKLCSSSQKQKAALWLAVRVMSFNLAGPVPSLYIFKKQLREHRWNNRKIFVEEFGRNLNIC